MSGINYSQKFAEQLAKFERWQATAEELERAAVATAQRMNRTRGDDGEELYVDYAAGKLLSNHYPYTQACNNRNAHQKRANLYGLAAILQHLDGQPTAGEVIPRGMIYPPEPDLHLND